MAMRKIEFIVEATETHYVGDGFRVHTMFPIGHLHSLSRLSPFFLMDYNSPHYFAPSDTPRGVGVHPHRGFETVTIAYKGKVEHHDSHGGGGIIEEGDVQWMTAASGVLHKELHEKEWSKKGGLFHMVQLWVNLPAKYKMSVPKYQAISNKIMGKATLPENSGIIEIIAGEYDGVKGPASTFSPINLFNVKIKQDRQAKFSFPSNYNTAILLVEGNIAVDGVEIQTNSLAVFENKGEDFTIQAISDAIILVLSGEPLNEPISSHGPFVMNTREEIIQAFEDFRDGKFGYLED